MNSMKRVLSRGFNNTLGDLASGRILLKWHDLVNPFIDDSDFYESLNLML